MSSNLPNHRCIKKIERFRYLKMNSFLSVFPQQKSSFLLRELPYMQVLSFIFPGLNLVIRVYVIARICVYAHGCHTLLIFTGTPRHVGVPMFLFPRACHAAGALRSWAQSSRR